jgi:hypothetical protein
MAACGAGSGAPAGDGVVRTTTGDTTEVRTLGDGPWGDSASLVEEVAIGELEGAAEYQFGAVGAIAVDADGGVYVFDGQVPALRYYGADGRFVRQLGREGEGPGEYKDMALGLAIRRGDGRVVMRDPRNGRLNVYDPDGSPSDSWPVASGLYTGQATALDDADEMYLKILAGQPEPGKPWPIALLHLDAQGAIRDTIVPPTLADEPPAPNGWFSVAKLWAVARDGGVLVGVNDRYVIKHYRRDGTVLRIVRDGPRPRVLPEEQAEYEARDAWTRKNQGQFATPERSPVPDRKPVFKEIASGEDGRIWVRRYEEAVKGEPMQSPQRAGGEVPPALTWREPTVYDVFESDGAFLGSLRVPRGTTLSVFRGDRVWGVRRGEFGEAYVVRYRIVHG